jgi:autotransporter translocation and assembly factor TamB
MFDHISAENVHIHMSEKSTPPDLSTKIPYEKIGALAHQRLFRAIHIKNFHINKPHPINGSLRLEPHVNGGQNLQIKAGMDELNCHIAESKKNLHITFQGTSPAGGTLNHCIAAYANPSNTLDMIGFIRADFDTENPMVQGSVDLTYETLGKINIKAYEQNTHSYAHISATPKNKAPVELTLQMDRGQKDTWPLTGTLHHENTHLNLQALWGDNKIHITKMDGQLHNTELVLETPILLDCQHKTTEAARLRFGQTTLDLSRLQFPTPTSPWQGEITFQNPLNLSLENTHALMTGKITLSGTSPMPHLEGQCDIQNLQANLKPFHLSLTGTYENEAATLTLTAKHKETPFLTLSGKVTNLLETPTLNLKTTGNINLTYLEAFLGRGDKIQGTVQAHLTLSGTITAPHLIGTLTMDDGYYENAFSGTLLNHVRLVLKGEGPALTIEQLLFDDGQKNPGTVSGEGAVHLKDLTPTFNIKLNLNKFKIAHNDGIEGYATGFLALQGTGGDAKITGEAMLDPLILWLEELAPVDIPKLEQVEDKTMEGKKSPPPPYLFMDVLLKTKEIYMSGFGINSVWQGNMQLINPVFSPDLLGTITLKNGKIELLGKPMNLKKGTITYDLEKLSDPILKIRATKEHSGEKVSLKIEGRASSPQFTFTSSPPLPEEEVLSRILFGKEISAISPSQSLQLAAAAASMNGQNGLNIMDTFRKTFRFDSFELKDNKRMNVSSGEEQTVRALSVGKEFGAVKLSIDQGVSTGSKSKATIEMEISKNLSLEGDVGGDRSSGVGITWVKRY